MSQASKKKDGKPDTTKSQAYSYKARKMKQLVAGQDDANIKGHVDDPAGVMMGWRIASDNQGFSKTVYYHRVAGYGVLVVFETVIRNPDGTCTINESVANIPGGQITLSGETARVSVPH